MSLSASLCKKGGREGEDMARGVGMWGDCLTQGNVIVCCFFCKEGGVGERGRERERVGGREDSLMFEGNIIVCCFVSRER